MQSIDRLRAELAKARTECERLRQENANLKIRLEDKSSIDDLRRIAPRKIPIQESKESAALNSVTNNCQPTLKISLFRSLFRGREDVRTLFVSDPHF